MEQNKSSFRRAHKNKTDQPLTSTRHNIMVFEDYLTLASLIGNCPHSYFTFFVKEERHTVIKSEETCSVIPGDTICKTILEKRAPLIVSDLHSHPEFCNNPFVLNTKPSPRFYAGFPIFFEDALVGSLCIVDYVPRQLTSHQITGMKILVEKCSRELESKTMDQSLEDILNYQEHSEDLLEIRENLKNILIQKEKISMQEVELNQLYLELTQKKRELELITDSSPFCISFIDTDYCYQFNNKTYEDWFGVSNHSLKGQSIKSVLGEQTFQKVKQHYDRAFSGHKFVLEENILFNNGEEKFLRVTYIPARNHLDEIIGVYLFAEDLSEINKYQKELKRSNDELMRFAHAASHDLKSPSRLMTHFSQLLLKKYSDQLDDNGKEYLNFIATSAIDMQNLIDTLLEFAQAGKKENEKIQTLTMEDILYIVNRNLKLEIQESHTLIQVKNKGVKIKCNLHKSVQIFQNIISNSIKYRNPKNAPTIQIEAKNQGTFVQFSISDNGIGIKEEHITNIFNSFYRIHHEQKNGFGIGLTTCLKIVESYGGKIWVESEYGKGSVFHFTLPANENGVPAGRVSG